MGHFARCFEKKARSPRVRFIIIGFLLLFIVHCGRDNLSQFIQSAPKELRFATNQEIDSNSVLPGSYIAQIELPQSQLSFGAIRSFDQEYSSFFPSIEGMLSGIPEIKDFYFLSAIAIDGRNGFRLPFLTGPSGPLKLPFLKDQKTPVRVMARIDFQDETSAQSRLEELQKNGRVLYAEPNFQSHLSTWTERQTQYSSLVEDGGTSFKWLSTIRLPESFGELGKIADKTETNPIIAVMDSGVDIEHPALKNQIWVNDGGLGQSGCGDSDENGCNTTALSRGRLGNGDVYPFGTKGMGEKCPETSFGRCSKNCCHGTHVAGIIAGDPTSGVAGVCPECRIMVLKVVGATPGTTEGSILDSSIIAALKYLTNFRVGDQAAVRVVNASFGKFLRSHTVSALVRALVNTPQKNLGTIIIGAAGNEDSSKMQYPAAYSSAIAVANIGNDGSKHTSSNFGRWVDIAAPGERIVSSVPGGLTEPKTGTSMAAPVVSGVAGLILSNRPGVSIEELRKNLLSGAVSKKLYENQVNEYYLMKIADDLQPTPLLGQGYLDAFNSVAQVSESTIQSDRLDRVQKSCASIEGLSKNSGINFMVLLIFFFPLAWFLIFSRQT